jgi:hypothetical protein
MSRFSGPGAPIAVVPQLGRILRERGVTVLALQRAIAERFGRIPDDKTLYGLAGDKPVQRPDLNVAAAAATVLRVPIGDLFRVEVPPPPTTGSVEADSRRAAELFALRAEGRLDEAGQRELDALLGRFQEYRRQELLDELARRDGKPVEQVAGEASAELFDAVRGWRGYDARRRTGERQAAGRAGRRRRPGPPPTDSSDDGAVAATA